MADELTSQNRLENPLLSTRFFFPSLPVTTIPRPRLTDLLNPGLNCPLTLVSAPPGFGKSSLIIEWIHSQPNLKAGWLSLESSDQDWRLFFRYLVGAWQRIFPQAGQAALAELGASSMPDMEHLAILLLNDLLVGMDEIGAEHAMLVLDDYHRIEAPAIHQIVAYLVEHLPPGCHIALLTRSDPPLPLANWRSHHKLLEVRADDLRFTSEETRKYFGQGMRLELKEGQIETLLERTEGWIVGLQMAALAIQASVKKGQDSIQSFVDQFGGSNSFVVDYLLEEVFHRQPQEVQQFLLASAPFDQFCAPLCDVLQERAAPSSQQMLENLEKANLFVIGLDDRRYWFRYHHLFSDLLVIRLQQTDPDRLAALYRRAATWFVEMDAWREAIRYGLLTQDINFGADLFEQAVVKGGLSFLYSGIGSLIEAFPLSIVKVRPLLSLAKAVSIFATSQLDSIEPWLRFAEEGIRSSPPFPGQEAVLGWIYVIQGNVATLLGDHNWMIKATREMPKWISQDFITRVEALVQVGNAAYFEGDYNQAEVCWQQVLDLSISADNTYYKLSLLNGLGRLCYQKGELNRSDACFAQAFDLLKAYGEQYPIWLGAMQRDRCELVRERNHLDEARALIDAALPLLKKWHTKSAFGYGMMSKARILLACGDLAGANEILRQVDVFSHTYTIYPDLETLAQVTRSRLLLEEGDPAQARQVLESWLESDCCQYGFIKDWVLIALARVLVTLGQPDEALALLAGKQEQANAKGRGRDWLAIVLIMALGLHSRGDLQNAINLLGEGLEFARAQDFRRIFIDEGERMRALLEEFRKLFPVSPLAAYVSELISGFPSLPSAKMKDALLNYGLYEALSGREQDILKLICQGLSNQEIADCLVLSVGTVKFHIHNLFGKLGVRDRPQAIVKASQLGLSS